MVTVAFKPGEKEISKYEELDQYDYGQFPHPGPQSPSCGRDTLCIAENRRNIQNPYWNY